VRQAHTKLEVGILCAAIVGEHTSLHKERVEYVKRTLPNLIKKEAIGLVGLAGRKAGIC
jgi:hypothetical protein